MTTTSDVRAGWDADGVYRITLDRPAKRNAVTPAMVAALDHFAARALLDPAVRVVVIAGAGGAFSAGADLGTFAAGGSAAAEFVRHGNRFVARLAAAHKPVVAAVDGLALGGGFEIALGCTFRVASERSTFGLPEVTLGLLPAWGGVTNLAALCGPAVARDLALTGRTLTAAEAHALGIVHRVVPADGFADAVTALAARLAGWSPAAVAGILELSVGGVDRGREADLFDGVVETEAARAALGRFLNKRAA